MQKLKELFHLRDLWMFLAGFMFFHMISHLLLPFYFNLPYKFLGFKLTERFNIWVIIISGLLTLGFLFLAAKRKR
jgi:hypothetical protein